MSRQDFFLLMLTVVGFIVAFPPFPTGFVAFGALVPFFFFLEGKKPGSAFRGGYVVGLIWTGGTIYWIGWATVLGFIGALLWLPLYVAFYAVLHSWLWKKWGKRSLLFVPFVWTGVEIVTSWGDLGFTWNSLAYTQTYYPTMIQYASILGMHGVTFWVVLLNVLFFFLLKCGWQWKRCGGWILLILPLFLLPWAYGKSIVSRSLPSEKEMRLALVQGNIDPYKKWTASFIDSNFTTYERLTWLAQKENPDLIVWPETATPCYLRYNYVYLNRVKSQVNALGIPLLTGSPDYEWKNRGKPEAYNAALLITPNSWSIDRYHKMHLVPFSEKVPFRDKVPFLYNALEKIHAGTGDFVAGDSIVVFRMIPRDDTTLIRFSTIICYESIFPYLVREFIRHGAQFLIVITNDAWFGRTSGPYQHAQIAVYRAIENRVWVARCANTGISEFIDPFGRICSKTALYQEAVLGQTISLGWGKSFFVDHGTLFLWFILGTNGLIFFGTFFGKETSEK